MNEHVTPAQHSASYQDVRHAGEYGGRADPRRAASAASAGILIAALKDGEPVRVPPFDAVEFSLAALWPD